MTEPSEFDEQAIREQLNAVEQEMVEKLALLHTHHQELQNVDYTTNIRALRPYLDMWMDWHHWATYWLVQARIARNDARAVNQESWQNVVMNARPGDLPQAGGSYTSYEERKVFYDINTSKSRRRLDQLDQIVDTTFAFIAALKTAYEHWDKRRVDTKWELDRMSRLPGSDYVS